VKCLRKANGRAERQSVLVKINLGYTREIHADIVSIPCVPCPELVEHGWAKDMDVAELEIRCCHLGRIQEAAKEVAASVPIS
jgi:hypothetical protein